MSNTDDLYIYIMYFQLRRVQHETKDITLKTKKMEDAMKNLFNDFNESYNKLEVIFKKKIIFKYFKP